MRISTWSSLRRTAANTSRAAPPSLSLLVALRGSGGVGSGATGPDLRAKAAGGGSHGAATGPLARATATGTPVAAAAAGWSGLRAKAAGGVSHDSRRGRELEREPAGAEEAAGGGNCSGVDLRMGGRRGWNFVLYSLITAGSWLELAVMVGDLITTGS